MAYRFERDFATIQDGLRQIAVDVIDNSTKRAGRKAKDVNETVHALRKNCKKLRGLIRLVGPAFDDYRAENAVFRDAGRKFSFVRDGSVLLKTYDSLLENYKDKLEQGRFAPIRRRLTLLQKELAESDEIRDRLKEFRRTMMEARDRAHRWCISDDGFDVLGRGVTKSYKRAQRAMAEAAKEPNAEVIHQWRKRVKDHWYHTRLLCPISRRPMSAHCTIASRLCDSLGEHHDLEVFRQRLVGDDFGDKIDLDILVGLVRHRQTALERESFAIGARLLAEPAADLTQRWRTYWGAWRKDEGRMPEAVSTVDALAGASPAGL